MKVTIITPCLNSERTIGDTIQSVISQVECDIEYIVVDGGSVDNTLGIINSYKNKISKVISEPDQGIYDAMNKGIENASGEIIGILNSDDFFVNNQVIGKINQVFSDDPQIQMCYGDIVYVDRHNVKRITRKWRARSFDRNKLNFGWIPPHPAVFIKKELYNELGKYNLDLKIAADYELLLRFLMNLDDEQICYLDEYIVKMRSGGTSAQNLKQRLKGWQEIKKSWAINNLEIPKFLITKRILSKIFQFI